MYLKQLAQLVLTGSAIPYPSISNPISNPSTSTSKSNEPGYSLDTPSTVKNSSFTFGQNYAVLNLDLIDGLVSSFNDTDAGEKWIDNVASWIDACVPLPCLSMQSARAWYRLMDHRVGW